MKHTRSSSSSNRTSSSSQNSVGSRNSSSKSSDSSSIQSRTSVSNKRITPGPSLRPNTSRASLDRAVSAPRPSRDRKTLAPPSAPSRRPIEQQHRLLADRETKMSSPVLQVIHEPLLRATPTPTSILVLQSSGCCSCQEDDDQTLSTTLSTVRLFMDIGSQLGMHLGHQSLRIGTVLSGSQAEVMGVSAGWRCVAIGGEPVSNLDEFRAVSSRIREQSLDSSNFEWVEFVVEPADDLLPPNEVEW